MKPNSTGQVAIPAESRSRHDFVEEDEVEVVEDGATLRIAHSAPSSSRGERAASRLRGRAATSVSTGESVELLHDE